MNISGLMCVWIIVCGAKIVYFVGFRVCRGVVFDVVGRVDQFSGGVVVGKGLCVKV